MFKVARVVVTVAFAVAGLQTLSAAPRDGVYVGAEAGFVDHHFTLEETSAAGRSEREVHRNGVAGGIFAGYDRQVSERLRLAVEGGVHFGGRAAATTSMGGQRFSIDPSYGYSVTGRAGYRIGATVVPYVGAGYGGHRYDLSAAAAANGFGNWNHSFILLTGVEIAASPHLRFRLEAMHLDGTRNQVMLGVPIRFR